MDERYRRGVADCARVTRETAAGLRAKAESPDFTWHHQLRLRVIADAMDDLAEGFGTMREEGK